MDQEKEWDIIVKPKAPLFQLHLSEIWAYRDLILLLVRRDITANYKQTLLGPAWMFMQPVFVTAIYTFTFSVAAGLSTDGLPPALFYLMGQTFWNYFSDCLNKTANTFVNNASVFGKVYFPRLVVPISVVLSNLAKLAIQLTLLAAVYIFYFLNGAGVELQFKYILLLPLLVVQLGMFSLSLGIVFSSFTTKYRDFTFMLGFLLQLIMFLSFVTFPASMFTEQQQAILLLNPIGSCLEAIKFILTGHGIFSPYYLLIGTCITVFLFFFSVLLFNKTERSFMDTV